MDLVVTNVAISKVLVVVIVVVIKVLVVEDEAGVNKEEDNLTMADKTTFNNRQHAMMYNSVQHLVCIPFFTFRSKSSSESYS